MSKESTHHGPHGDILVVEDNAPDLKFMSEFLKKSGYRVRPASDGELAIRSVSAKLPDLIILDVNLPGINGIEVCRRLKSDPATSELPVIFISAHKDTNLKVMALEAGGTDFVTKPIEPTEVVARINTHLSISRMQRRLAIQSEVLTAEIEERKLAERKLQTSEKQFRQLTETIKEVFWSVSPDWQEVKYISPAYQTVWGKSCESLYSSPNSWMDSIIEEDKEKVLECIKKVERDDLNDIIFPEYRIVLNDKTFKWILARGFPIENEQGIVVKIVGIAEDITQRKQSEQQIKASLKEKETLLQEIHHRVKNNMTIISSLLGLQKASVGDEKAKEALQDSRNRVQTMSMIHETLYRSDNLSAIDMKTYLSELGIIIFQGYKVGGKVGLKIEAENILIGAKQAPPLGLIVNELITNSLKYAFPNDRKGKIVLNFKLNKESEVELIVSDNGIGIPEGFDWQNADSLGLKLVRTLVENQLDGSIEMQNNNGAKFIIKFNIEA